MTLNEFRTSQKNTFKSGFWCCTYRNLSNYMAAFNLTLKHIENLSGKKLLLIGGGRSPIQETFDRMHINCHVTNVDAYINEPKSARTICNNDFVDVDFVNEFDACWALWSLPLYSPNRYHAATFYARAAIALKPDGKLFVSPRPRDISGTIVAEHLERTFANLRLLELELDEMFNSRKETLISRYNKEGKVYEYWCAPESEHDKQILNRYLRMKINSYGGNIYNVR